MKRYEILNNARLCVTQDRNNLYGEPEDVLSNVALLWDAYTKIVAYLRDVYEETDFDVCMKQILLKVARALHNPEHIDNYVDIAGYAACCGEIATSKKTEPLDWAIK